MALVSRRSGEDEDTIFLVKQQGRFPSPGQVGGPHRHIPQHMQSSRRDSPGATERGLLSRQLGL